MNSFDYYLDNRIQFGKYQIQQFAVTMISVFNIAFIEFFFIQIVQIIKKEENLNNFQIELFHSSFFLGMTIGFLICILCKDKYGRKNLILLSYLIITCCSFISSIVYNIYILLIARIGIGASFSIGFSLSYICWIEIMPTQHRGKGIVIGEIIFVLVSIFFISYDEGNWRLIVQVHIILNVLGFLSVLLKMKESPRILLMQQKFPQAFDIIEYMIKRNNCQSQLTEPEKLNLQKWAQQITQQKKARIREIFNKNNRKVTFMLWLLQILLNLIDKGILALMPIIFERTHQDIKNLFWIYVPELFSIFISYKIVDSKQYFGRKRGFQLGFALLIIPLLIILIVKRPAIYYCYFGIRFSIRCMWIFNHTLCIESYQTLYRTIGVCSAQSVGKLFGSFAPFLILPLYFYHGYIIFLYLSLFCLIGILILQFYPKDKTLEPMDQGANIEQEEKIEMKEQERQVVIENNDKFNI